MGMKNEHDEVIHDTEYSRYVLRHYINSKGVPRVWGIIHSNVLGPGAQVLAITSEHKVILERSYRVALGTHVIELPGGSNER